MGKKTRAKTESRKGCLASGEPWCAEFLEALADEGTVRAACRAVKVSRRTVVYWKKDDPVFAEDIGFAEEDFKDLLRGIELKRLKGEATEQVIDRDGYPVFEEDGETPFMRPVRCAGAERIFDLKKLIPEWDDKPDKIEQNVTVNTPKSDDNLFERVDKDVRAAFRAAQKRASKNGAN